MRLSKIKLAGFKSFVDPTSISLPGNLTGVVGPNGCGKSNIIDAVRWVMGESSAKHLRGDSMTDVIFNGSSSRKPVGQASIELVFDNSDGSVAGQYASFNEISIRRVVTREAQSSYFLNGSRCRRRDITDIFLGTGLGPRSYAIIEQGTISRLIEARPDEMRNFLEEAAGISKYKERRRETENRMRHTRDNLERLDDLRDELGKQLAHLQRQARTAERYKEYKAEERHLKGQLQALRWKKLNHELEHREGDIREQETGLEAQVARQRSAEAEIERKRDEHVEATEGFNKIQSEFYGVGADIARLEQSIQHARERHQQLERDLGQVERAWNEAQLHQEMDRNKIEELTRGLDEQGPAHQELQAAAELSSATLSEAEEAMQCWQAEWEEFNQKAAEPSQTAQVERARIQQLEQQVTQLGQRLGRIDEEQANLSTERLAEEIATVREQIAEQEIGLATIQERRSACLDQIGQVREQNSEDGKRLDEIRSRLQSRRGRHASLEALQQAALGKGQGAVTDWLDARGMHDAPRLAEGLSVAEGWEKAVECVLGAHLEAVCVEGLDPVVGALGSLEHGALTLFDTQAAVVASDAAKGMPLATRVSGERTLDGLLNGVYGVDNLDAALGLRARLAGHESVITRDGIWIGPNWLRVVRDSDEHAGVLHREQELKELQQSIETLESEAKELARRVEEGRGRQRELEEEREQLQSELTEANRIVSELQSLLSGKQACLEQIEQRRDRLQAEAEELKRHQSEAEEGIQSAHYTLHRALEEMEELAQLREELTRRRAELREMLEQSRERAHTDREAAQETAIRIQTMRTELETTRHALERAEQQLTQLAERREELKMSRAEGGSPVEGMNEELEQQLAHRMEVEARLKEARRRVEDIDHLVREREGERIQAERVVQEIRSKLEQKRMGWQELKVRRQTLEEQVTESDQELNELIDSLPDHAEIAAWEKLVDDIVQRVARLGPINLAAIDEFEQQSQRRDYLDAQHADLMEALETLESAIKKIDRETRTRFKETFERVNKGLQEKFPRLFGGGHAYLELIGDDLLDTGVAVMARPPGKRNSSIHLLSGGEKALTAVALVFAIFELNPSPFCMLDEVDAPLDEANVGRFCSLVKEMSERVQFIFITHNKVTMELSGHLAGVTMHEPGVSRMVAVDVDKAIELAAV
ncbi:chromosome segregation protein SMC [Thiohalomonas denitrificans]|uniref:chromosome segregation protein SMC n=1 Tax=Thiohalomonas denitrificans TaxID=415747 RepID=UPI0026F0FC70|nr:chromosome segregation protein SMC [Thiohalomonas denitrificans]